MGGAGYADMARRLKDLAERLRDELDELRRIEKTAMIRVRAGISYALTEALNDGHCGLPVNELSSLAEKLLEVPAALIETATALELAEKTIVKDSVEETECVFLAGLYQSEKVIAERILRLAAGKPSWPEIDGAKAIDWLATKSSFALADSQKQAVELALHSKVLVITGGPGVGKTTIVNSILRILKAKNVEMLLCAPTGRAAKRMSEATGHEAKTIHRLLEVDPQSGGFRKDQDNPLDTDLLVVDEASMIDVPLMHALVKAVPSQAALLIVGDIDQVPSVGPGQVLADLIASGAVPVVRLTEVFRQAAQSRIVTMAHRINKGEMPEFEKPEGDSDYYFVEANEPERAIEVIMELVRERIPKRFGLDPIRDIQILCPMNRGGLGARSLNIDLQKALNPPGQEKIEKFGSTSAPKDKVMQIENDYDKEVYNGDLRFITKIDAEAGGIGVHFDGRGLYESGGLNTSGPCLRDHHPQSTRLRISGCHPTCHDATSPDASAQSSLHRPHARKAACRARRTEKGGRDRCAQCDCATCSSHLLQWSNRRGVPRHRRRWLWARRRGFYVLEQPRRARLVREAEGDLQFSGGDNSREC